MSHYIIKRSLSYTPQNLFCLVADVERYPEFVPWWVAATVWKRDMNVYHTRQILGLPFIHLEFQSVTTLDPYRYIAVQSIDYPFKNLDMEWYFKEDSEKSTVVYLEVNYEFRTTRYTFLNNLISESGIHHLIDAFEKRALQLFSKERQQNFSTIIHCHEKLTSL